MAALAETRDVGSALPLPGTIRRVCCIGDSITYGQGVTPRQTLAMHIARFANMAYPDQLVWVDNRGQSSGNIWHSWVPFARLAEEVRYDAAIFSLCQNDCQIFESNSVKYADAEERGWLREGRLTPILRRTIADLARTAGARDLCLVLNFYTLWDNDAPLIEAVARECKSVGLPFVDLLHYLKRESGLPVAEYVSSPFDGHPSDSGHRAAARRLVEALKDHWQPPAPEGLAVAERLVVACDQAIRDGWPPDDIFHWAFLVLDAKEIVARRQRAKSGVASFGDLAGARAAVEERYRLWYADRGAAVQARVLYERRDELWIILDRLHASIRNLDEMSFVVEHFQDSPTAAELWALIDKAGHYNQANRLLKLPANLNAQLLEKAAAAMPTLGKGLGGAAQEFGKLRLDLDRNLRQLAALLPDRLQVETLDPNAMRLWQVTRYLVDVSWTYVLQFVQAIAETTIDLPKQPVFFTTVDVRVERDRSRARQGGKFNLTVEMDYIEPRRARRSSMVWGGADEHAYIYSFEMPLLLLGDVGIGVPTWDDVHRRFLDGELRLARVEVSNFPAEAARPKAPFVWEPSRDAEPIHWLKLQRLAIPTGAAGMN